MTTKVKKNPQRPKAPARRPKENPGILAAIAKVGSQERLGDLLDVTQATVSYWLHSAVPVARAYQIERTCGVSARLIRPDVFGEE